jgi:hypothetical protein
VGLSQTQLPTLPTSNFQAHPFLNPSLLGYSLPLFDFSTRPGRLETVPSRSISYAGLSQILVFSLIPIKIILKFPSFFRFLGITYDFYQKSGGFISWIIGLNMP